MLLMFTVTRYISLTLAELAHLQTNTFLGSMILKKISTNYSNSSQEELENLKTEERKFYREVTSKDKVFIFIKIAYTTSFRNNQAVFYSQSFSIDCTFFEGKKKVSLLLKRKKNV